MFQLLAPGTVQLVEITLFLREIIETPNGLVPRLGWVLFVRGAVMRGTRVILVGIPVPRGEGICIFWRHLGINSLASHTEEGTYHGATETRRRDGVNLRRFLRRNHAQISAMVVMEGKGAKRSLRSISSPSPSTSVSEQVRAFPGPDLFANLCDGLNSVPLWLRGESSRGAGKYRKQVKRGMLKTLINFGLFCASKMAYGMVVE
jgi:hypothetical protein